jgi:hypothetical protein
MRIAVRRLLLATLALVVASLPLVAQMGWKAASPTTSPPPRDDFGMAYDAARMRTVVFGGYANGKRLSDTWEWDGTTWTNRSPLTGPAARDVFPLAYDAARRRCLLFGGTGANSDFGDTWEWDGLVWAQRKPLTRPSPRSGHAMAYDAARHRVVLFGGSDPKVEYADTWEWDGQTWVKANPSSSPPALVESAMTYDAARKRILLFGGVHTQPTTLISAATWEWDGANWKKRTTSGGPSPRVRPRMAYDDARQRVVLFGGENFSGELGDTWEWNGNSWSQRTLKVSPSRRAGHGMAYDPVEGRTILFGGKPVGGGYLADTWVYSPTDLVASTYRVSAAAGGKVTFTLNAGIGYSGQNYWLVGCLHGSGPRGIPISPSIQLLLFPDDYFTLTVTYPYLLFANSQGTLGRSGTATATLSVPKLPATVVGLRLYHAYVVYSNQITYASTAIPLTLVK